MSCLDVYVFSLLLPARALLLSSSADFIKIKRQLLAGASE